MDRYNGQHPGRRSEVESLYHSHITPYYVLGIPHVVDNISTNRYTHSAYISPIFTQCRDEIPVCI